MHTRKAPPSTAISSVDLGDFNQLNFWYPASPFENEQHARVSNLVFGLARNALVLASNDYACFRETESTATFDIVPGFAKGREQSRHGVFFGVLAVQSTPQVPITTFAAVKPYDRRKIDLEMKPCDAVTHDLSTLQFLNRLSAGTSYDPVGVWRDNDTFVVPRIITKFNEGSVSLDNFLEEPIQERLIKAAKLGHFGLGILHGSGIIHRDAFPQNFATNANRVIFNDVTTFRHTPNDSAKSTKDVSDDIQAFLKGLTHERAVDNEEVRSLMTRLLLNEQFLEMLYGSYIEGAALAKKRLLRSGKGKDDIHHKLATKDEHTRSLPDYIKKMRKT